MTTILSLLLLAGPHWAFTFETPITFADTIRTKVSFSQLVNRQYPYQARGMVLEFMFDSLAVRLIRVEPGPDLPPINWEFRWDNTKTCIIDPRLPQPPWMQRSAVRIHELEGHQFLGTGKWHLWTLIFVPLSPIGTWIGAWDYAGPSACTICTIVSDTGWHWDCANGPSRPGQTPHLVVIPSNIARVRVQVPTWTLLKSLYQ